MKELLARLGDAERELLLDNLTDEEREVLGDDPEFFPLDYGFEDATGNEIGDVGDIHGRVYDPSDVQGSQYDSENDPNNPFFVDDKESSTKK